MGYLPFQESDHVDDEGTYVTAPTSPIIITAAGAGAAAEEEEEEEEEGSMALFYSLPSSPMKRTLHRNLSAFVIEDDFEFETSKKFRLQSAELEKTLSLIQQQQNNKKNQNLVLPEIAFADELFSKGVVVLSSPLKLPPGRIPPTAAKTTTPSSSFSEIGNHPSCLRAGSPWRHNTWKDGFDPFAAAIQKIVKEEVRKEESPATVGKSEQKTRGHRRAHSLCIPPKLIHPQPSPKPGSKEKRHERTESDGHANLLMRPKSNKLHEMGVEQNPTTTTTTTVVPYSPDELALNTQNGGVNGVNGPNGLNWRVTSRKQGMGKFLRRYATFKNEKNEGKIKEQIASLWRSSSFKRMSLRFKESRHNNHSRGFSQDEKKVGQETKMAIPNYQPKFATCLGIGGRKGSSPT